MTKRSFLLGFKLKSSFFLVSPGFVTTNWHQQLNVHNEAFIVQVPKGEKEAWLVTIAKTFCFLHDCKEECIYIGAAWLGNLKHKECLALMNVFDMGRGTQQQNEQCRWSCR